MTVIAGSLENLNLVADISAAACANDGKTFDTKNKLKKKHAAQSDICTDKKK